MGKKIPVALSTELLNRTACCQSIIRPTAVNMRHLIANTSLGYKGNVMHSVSRPFKSSSLRYEHPHDVRKLWIVEKSVSALMVPLLPVALLLQNKILDTVVAVLITSHAFWGLEALVVEYMRVILVGPVVPKVCMLAVYSLTLMMMGGFYYLIYNDVGLCRAFWRIWKNMRKPHDKKSA